MADIACARALAHGSADLMVAGRLADAAARPRSSGSRRSFPSSAASRRRARPHARLEALGRGRCCRYL